MKLNLYPQAILLLTIPAIIESLLQSMDGFVNTLFISKLGIEEVAAVGIKIKNFFVT
ncbi:hypothetical protein [Bacillus sp. SA1-12]|uniref:hypothetical protein n=1 Tax=Bacillus sp. SA1-12 TaxID=1455638 RepID=UPI000B077864|nr:hypothetical protein [Bacillus sp. SA1-12]